MTAQRVLDMNVILRYVAADHPTMSPAARDLLRRIEDGEVRVIVTPMIVAEVVFTLQRFYRKRREEICEVVGALLNLPDMEIRDEAVCRMALELYQTHAISFADAYTAATMLHDGVKEIYSWDRDFDRIEGITRLEPTS